MTLVQDLVPPLALRLAKRAWQRLPANRYHGLNGIDRYLHARLPHRNGYFVELGANDGVSQSNSLFFERELGWTGLLVEPALNNYLNCVRNRSENTAVALAACVPLDFKDEVVWLGYADLMTTPMTLQSDLPDPAGHLSVAAAHMRKGERQTEFPARAVPLSRLLDEAGAPAEIDFLSLDVEGAELSVLQGIDHARHRFRNMVVESRDVDAIARYLGGNGYRLEGNVTHQDYHFVPDGPAA